MKKWEVRCGFSMYSTTRFMGVRKFTSMLEAVEWMRKDNKVWGVSGVVYEPVVWHPAKMFEPKAIMRYQLFDPNLKEVKLVKIEPQESKLSNCKLAQENI